jgi:ABC-type polysaccharide/polyol phosphate export permease
MESSQLPQDQSRVLSKSNDPLKFWFYRVAAVLNILVFVVAVVVAILIWLFMVEGGANWYYSLLFALMGFFGVTCVSILALSPLALLFWLIDGRYPLGRNFRVGLGGILGSSVLIATF